MSHQALQRLRDGLPWGQEAQIIINKIIELIVDASETVQGITRYATNAEAAAGVVTDAALVPSNFSGKAAAQTYTEGTFTPTLLFGGASTGITYSTQSGAYTRIGRLVHIDIAMVLTSKGSATGSATISGLPITVGSTSPATFLANLITAGVGDTVMYATFISGGTTLSLSDIAAGSAGALTDVDFGNASVIRINGWYRV